VFFLQKEVPKVDQEKLQQLNTDLSQCKLAQETLESDLVASNKKLLLVRSQLEMAEKELENKFAQTAGYKTMRQILAKKNDQIRNMRKVLIEHKIGDFNGEDGTKDD